MGKFVSKDNAAELVKGLKQYTDNVVESSFPEITLSNTVFSLTGDVMGEEIDTADVEEVFDYMNQHGIDVGDRRQVKLNVTDQNNIGRQFFAILARSRYEAPTATTNSATLNCYDNAGTLFTIYVSVVSRTGEEDELFGAYDSLTLVDFTILDEMLGAKKVDASDVQSFYELFSTLQEESPASSSMYVINFGENGDRAGVVNFEYTSENSADYIFGNKRGTIDFEDDGDGNITISYGEEIDLVDADYLTSNYLGKNNTTEFTPADDYNPATKKYVDDAIYGIGKNNIKYLYYTDYTSPSNPLILENLEEGYYFFGTSGTDTSCFGTRGIYVKSHESNISSMRVLVNHTNCYFRLSTKPTTSTPANMPIALFQVPMHPGTTGVGTTVHMESIALMYSPSEESGLTQSTYKRDMDLVNATDDQTVNGKKRFTTYPEIVGGLPAPSTDNQLVNKKYIDDIISQIDITNRLIVEELPEEDISTKTIYMVHKDVPGNQNVYEEYMYINDDWEIIGNTEVDLTNYATKDYVADSIASAIGDIEEVLATLTIPDESEGE